jgi:peptide/nickel transport system substrate-binding protein
MPIESHALHWLKNDFTTFLIILILAVASFSALTGTPAAYASASAATLTEWNLPTLNRGVWGLTLDASGNCCWFVEYYGNKVGHLDPATGTFQEWAIPTAGADPSSIATTAISGSLVVWGTESGTDKVFAFSPNEGLFREYNITRYNAGLEYISIESSSLQPRVWFTESFNNINGELIYNPKTGNVTLYEDSFPSEVGGGAYGVYATSGYVWFAGFSALVRWDRASQQYTIWQLPAHGSAVGRSITLDQYGEPWYTQGTADGISNDNFVGVLRGNTFQEWRIPNFGSDPRGISLNPLTQQPWIAEQSPTVGNGTVATLDTSGGGTFVSSSPTTASSGGAPRILAPTVTQIAVSTHIVSPTTKAILGSSNGQFTGYALGPTQPHEAIVDSSGNVWISEPGANEIARLSPSPDFALLVSPPTISISQGGSGIVTVKGVSSSNYTGQVSLAVTSLPPGVTASSFIPNPISIPSAGSVSSEFALNIAPDASNGNSTIIIDGTASAITHSVSFMLTITSSSSSSPGVSRCLIATATYGSNLAPEVQLLRNFRDNSVARSKAGKSFLIVFNAWYYSFSPSVAGYVSGQEIVRPGIRAVLYPLIGFISLASQLYSELSGYPEWATLLSGLVACSLTGAFYIGLPLGLLARRRMVKWRLNVITLTVLLLVPIGGILIGQEFSWTGVLMISSSMTVLATLLVSGLLMAKAVSRALSKHTTVRRIW